MKRSSGSLPQPSAKTEAISSHLNVTKRMGIKSEIEPSAFRDLDRANGAIRDAGGLTQGQFRVLHLRGGDAHICGRLETSRERIRAFASTKPCFSPTGG